MRINTPAVLRFLLLCSLVRVGADLFFTGLDVPALSSIKSSTCGTIRTNCRCKMSISAAYQRILPQYRPCQFAPTINVLQDDVPASRREGYLRARAAFAESLAPPPWPHLRAQLLLHRPLAHLESFCPLPLTFDPKERAVPHRHSCTTSPTDLHKRRKRKRKRKHCRDPLLCSY